MSISLTSLFQDGAVIQRARSIPVWGWAEPSKRVRVRLGPHTAWGMSGTRGDFLVRLPALDEPGPYTLRVELPETGENVEVHDILAGEVWIASGQSNMEWTLGQSHPVLDADIEAAEHPEIRFFNVRRRADLCPQRDVEGVWRAVTPVSAPDFSAVGFLFARRLHHELGCPVGIISSALGGTFIQAWMSRSALARNPDTAEWLADYEAEAWTESRWERLLSPDADGRVKNLPADPGNGAVEQGWASPEFDDSAWEVMDLPGFWQKAGHNHSGVFWFRRTIEIPVDWRGRDLELHLGAADKHDITYANGVEIGRTGTGVEEEHWDRPRVYRIPGELVISPTLTLAVRVYSFVFNGGLHGPACKMRVHPADEPGAALPLAGDWRIACEHNLGFVTVVHLMGHGERNTPHILFDNMLAPIAPYAVRGAIWYQGESNLVTNHLYASLLRGLIEDWRALWGEPDFAFHVVQLPGFHRPEAYQGDSEWARLREAQAEAIGGPHTGLAVAIDAGDPDDIHPKHKTPVGERLAQSVLVREYGRAGLPCGPLLESITMEPGAIRCRFQYAGSGLTTTDGCAPGGFLLAGADREFHLAEAVIEGAEVVVRSAAVASPEAVRYAWADFPLVCNLAGPEGLPAGPFRTDQW